MREEPDSAEAVRPPSGATPEEDLPLQQLDWGHFERLCLTLAEKSATFVDSALYGTRGQDQAGIDLLLRRPDGRHVTVQCRRVQVIEPAGIRTAVDDFLEGKFAAVSARFVLATSADTRATKTRDECEVQAARLRNVGIDFEVWDRRRLSDRLRDHPDLLLRFFGPAWRDLFRPDHAHEALADTVRREAQRVIDTVAGTAVVQELEELRISADATGAAGATDFLDGLLDVALGTVRIEPDVADVFKRLREARPQEAAKLAAAIATEPERVRGLIQVPTPWVTDGSAHLWNALGRLATISGDWGSAENAFRAAANAGTEDRARYLVRAHHAARLDERPADAAEHLSTARLLQPGLITLRVAELTQLDDVERRLRELADLTPVTDAERADVLCARIDALAALGRHNDALELVGDLIDSPANHLIGLDRRIGLTVSRETRTIGDGREPDRAALGKAIADSLTLVDRLRGRKRYTESGRCVTRAAEACAIAGDFQRAIELLETLTDLEQEDEITRLGGCQAAIHAQRPQFGLELLGPENQWNAAERRAGAHALLFLDEPHARIRAVEIARAAFNGDRPREWAAFVLLAAAASDSDMAWPSDAADAMQRLNPTTYVRLTADRMLLEGRGSDAEDLLLHHQDDVEALRALVDRYHSTERWPTALNLADQLIARSGRGDDRLRRAAILRGLGKRDAALAELRAVANDDDQPPELRNAAFRRLAAELPSADYAGLGRLSEDWLTKLPDDRDALVQTVFAYARLARHVDALALVRDRNLRARTLSEAHLLAEVYFRAAEPLEAAHKIAPLSDQFDRPERLEGLLFMSSLGIHGQMDSALAKRVGETYSTFATRFPNSPGIRQFSFDENNPEAFFDILHKQLRERQARSERLAREVRHGQAPVATFAVGMGFHIGEMLQQMNALPLGYSHEELDRLELGDAHAALGNMVVWDPTSLTVVASFPPATRRALLARLPGSAVATSTLAECDLAAVSPPAGKDGHEYITVEGDALSISNVSAETAASEREVLATALDLARGMAALPDLDPSLPDPFDAVLGAKDLDVTFATWPATIAVARRTGTAVYSDDRFVRITARREGVPAFGSLALLEAVRESGAISEGDVSNLRLALGRRGAWGLRMTADEIATLAAETNWQPTGRWVQALVDDASWRSDADAHLRFLVEVLRHAHRAAPAELAGWVARVIDFGHQALATFGPEPANFAVGLLFYTWLSPTTLADVAGERSFSVALLRALRAVPQQMPVPGFSSIVTEAAEFALDAVAPAVRGEMFQVDPQTSAAGRSGAFV